MYRQKFIFSITLGLLVGSTALYAASPEQNLEALLKNVTTISSKFEQRIYDSHNKLLQENFGSVVIKRPNLIYWQIDQPEASLVVSDGKKLWNYDQELEQVTVQPFNQENDLSPVTMLSGEIKKLNNEYSVEILGENNKICLQESTLCFRLTAKSNESSFKVIDLGFKKGVIHELELQDSLGQISMLIFKDVAINTKVNNKLFHFIPPEGVDVIRGIQ